LETHEDLAVGELERAGGHRPDPELAGDLGRQFGVRPTGEQHQLATALRVISGHHGRVPCSADPVVPAPALVPSSPAAAGPPARSGAGAAASAAGVPGRRRSTQLSTFACCTRLIASAPAGTSRVTTVPAAV